MCSLYLTCSFHVRKCIIFYIINYYPMFVSPKGTFCLLLLSLVKMGCDEETCGRNTYTEYPTNLTPGHREIRAHSAKASPPRLSASYQGWNGRQEPSHVLCNTQQVVGAIEKCLLLSKVCVICRVCFTVGGRGVVESFVKAYSRARRAV
jgi:hypothetical protein